jgi:hypothetical protein
MLLAANPQFAELKLPPSPKDVVGGLVIEAARAPPPLLGVFEMKLRPNPNT